MGTEPDTSFAVHFSWGLGNAVVVSDRPHRILLVEDEPWIRLALADHLEFSGFLVLEAASAGQAIAMVEAEPLIDLIFTDVRFPGDEEGGIKLARWVANHRPNIPVMLTSGDLSRAKGLEDLCHVRLSIIPKPYVHADVSAEMKELLEKKA
jgi:CheY-like chemotaxis protein